MLVDSSKNAYWQHISPATIKETGKSFTVVIPRSQPLDVTALPLLLALIKNRRNIRHSLPERYEELPPGAVRIFKRAMGSDELATARVADNLARGRYTPDLAAQSLISAKPEWLHRSPAAQDLWLAVGTFAQEHGHDVQAAQAFELAASRRGPHAARAKAFAGLCRLFDDREHAGELLRQAKREGQVLLADVGLPHLEIPDGDARAMPIPESMTRASAAELDAEPTVLNFLAEMAHRNGDLNAAVDYRERAVKQGNNLSGPLLLLAQSIMLRLRAEGGGSRREWRKALLHAQTTLEDRRRWNGPSIEALLLILEIHLLSGDFSDAVTAALPISEGGTARPHEAVDPEVARRAAGAALMLGDETRFTFFMRLLPEGPLRQELQNLINEGKGFTHEQEISSWRELLAQAVDGPMVVRCGARLAKLGVWPDQIDDLRARSILPQKTFDVLKAVHLTRTTDPQGGLTQLRLLARKDTEAGLALIELLDTEADRAEAITACQDLAARWNDPMFSEILAKMLKDAGRHQDVADLAERSLRDDSLPDDFRVGLCRWYVGYRGAARQYAEAAALARRGLDLAPGDSDLAWQLIDVLFRDGKTVAARAALARYAPEPVHTAEVELWYNLHLGVHLSAVDALTLTEVADRLPPGDLRAQLINLLVREVLTEPDVPETEHLSATYPREISEKTLVSRV